MKRALIIIVALVALLIAAPTLWYRAETGVACDQPKETRYTVKEGASTDSIASELKANGVIKSERGFKLAVKRAGVAKDFKAGQHTLNCADSAEANARKMTEQPEQRQFTIQEGLTQRQIAKKLAEADLVDEKTFAELKVRDFRNASKYDFLAELPDDASLEGFLFPETYSVPKLEGISDEKEKAKELASVMLNQFGQELTPQLREQIKASGRTLYQTVIIASMVESEVRSDTDRKLVAGIMYRRLSEDIRLDVDATTRYAVNKPTGTLTREDLDSDDPYNTRKVKGLPPGPISNPSLSAIRAAIEPQASEYLFYLSAKDGKTIFSKTLEEHESNVERYLR